VERLRFVTKNEPRTNNLLIGCAVLNAALVAINFLWLHRPIYIWLGPALSLIAYVLTLRTGCPGYAELGPAGLFLSLKQALIPYESIVSILPQSSGLDGFVVRTQEGKRFAITVTDDERFLTEVSKRCTLLERGDSGLLIPGAPQFTTF
jgi:hypothetical protein